MFALRLTAKLEGDPVILFGLLLMFGFPRLLLGVNLGDILQNKEIKSVLHAMNMVADDRTLSFKLLKHVDRMREDRIREVMYTRSLTTVISVPRRNLLHGVSCRNTDTGRHRSRWKNHSNFGTSERI